MANLPETGNLEIRLVRRYLLTCAWQPVYDLDALQDNSSPWALTLGANNND